MADNNLLQRLQQDFSEHLPGQENVTRIRHLISIHLQEFAGNGTYQIPSYVQGLRKQFLQASQADQNARRRLLDIQVREDGLKRPKSTKAILPTHLEVLALRRQHQNYQAISHYASHLENVSDRERVLESGPSHRVNTTERSHTNNNAISSEIDDLLVALETALLKANYQLQRERLLLEQVRSSSNNTNHSHQAKLHALEATRSELTAWIEESLSKCDLLEPVASVNPNESVEESSDLAESDIDEAYLQYCDARSRLISAATDLSQPLPVSNEPEDNREMIVPQAPYSMLPMIEAQFLPVWRESQVANRQLQFITESVKDNGEQLTESLQRLHDESHLLSAYPLLRETHQRSRSTTQDRETDGDHARMLGAWRFANEAAQITTGEAIIKQSLEGHESTNKVTDVLRSMKMQSDMWHQIGHNQT